MTDSECGIVAVLVSYTVRLSFAFLINISSTADKNNEERTYFL
jgi:hypothetical protein